MEKYIDIFNKLWEHSENEVVEFKKAETNFDIDELGKYFSALSNEANLRDHEFAWIVFGVWDKKHQIIGTSFKDSEVALNRLKQDMSQHTTDNLIFRDIVPIKVEGKRVLLFQVPASPRNIVMHWKGVAYGRDGESLKPLNQAKQDAIRQQPPIPDWTAQLVPNATINDLDELAVATAKVMFKKVHSSSIPAEEIDAWTTEEFLANCMMMRDGQLTRAPHYTISLKVAKLTKQIGHYTKEKGLAENSIQKLLLQLAHNAGSMGFKRQDVYEGLQHVFPSNLTHDEKLRKIGRLLGIMSKEGLISKLSTGKKWNITEKGESELGA